MHFPPYINSFELAIYVSLFIFLSFQFYVMMMDKAEKSVEVVVIRETSTERLHLTMKVEETPADKVYR